MATYAEIGKEKKMKLEKVLKCESCNNVEIVNQNGEHLFSGTPRELINTIYAVAQVIAYSFGKITVQW